MDGMMVWSQTFSTKSLSENSFDFEYSQHITNSRTRNRNRRKPWLVGHLNVKWPLSNLEYNNYCTESLMSSPIGRTLINDQAALKIHHCRTERPSSTTRHTHTHIPINYSWTLLGVSLPSVFDLFKNLYVLIG